MDNQATVRSNRIHPLMAGAAVAVIGVSLLGVAALTGLLPSSHGSVSPSVTTTGLPAGVTTSSGVVPIGASAGSRYVTTDGQVLELVPVAQTNQNVQSYQRNASDASHQPAAPVRRKPVQHYASSNGYQVQQPQRQQYAQNTYSEPVRSYQQPAYTAPQHPVQNYVSDMHPVGTGVGAVVGGLLGNQVGGGNGKKVATVAGALLGGYAGNEVSHNRNPLAW